MPKQRVIMTYPPGTQAVMTGALAPATAGTIVTTRRIGNQVMFDVAIDSDPYRLHRRVPAHLVELIDMSNPGQVERWLDA